MLKTLQEPGLLLYKLGRVEPVVFERQRNCQGNTSTSRVCDLRTGQREQEEKDGQKEARSKWGAGGKMALMWE